MSPTAAKNFLRHITLLFLALFLISKWAGAAEPMAPHPENIRCTLTSPTYDTHEVSCLVQRSEMSRRLEFKALFSGGHDDTLVTIRPSLDGTELACESGSKLRSFAEDGDITLVCQFAPGGPANTGAIFKATIQWSHAQFTSFSLLPQ